MRKRRRRRNFGTIGLNVGKTKRNDRIVLLGNLNVKARNLLEEGLLVFFGLWGAECKCG